MSARTWIQMGEAVVGALETIEKLTNVGGDKAEPALAAIRGVLAALREGTEQNVSPQAVLLQIESLHNAIAHGDDAALAEVLKRFP